MNARVFGGLARSTAGWTHDLNFEACSTAVDPRIISAGGANRTRVNAAGACVAATSAARVDHNPVSLLSRGLLQEPDNVSGVSNASASGAVVGTPGTLPTYWSRDKSAGQNIDVAGVGVESGLSYVDLRFWSAANDRSYLGVLFDPYGTIAATPGQVRYASLHVKHVGGTLTANHHLYNRATNAASGLLADTAVAFTPPASTANLLTSRYGVSHTLPATTAFVLPIYVAGLTVGPAFDYTLRFALPNHGLGSFVQSPIASSGVPLTATPATHFLSGSNFSSYFTPQGTYLIEFTPYALTNNEVYWGIGQASVFNNSMYLINSAGSLYLIVYSAGVNTVAFDLGVLVAGTRYKVAISYKSGEIAARCNGGTERVSSGAMPAVIDTEGLLTTPWNGGSSYPAAHMHRRRFRPYPSRGQLYQLTA